jgi:hypothetical protein
MPERVLCSWHPMAGVTRRVGNTSYAIESRCDEGRCLTPPVHALPWWGYRAWRRYNGSLRIQNIKKIHIKQEGESLCPSTSP